MLKFCKVSEVEQIIHPNIESTHNQDNECLQNWLLPTFPSRPISDSPFNHQRHHDKFVHFLTFFTAFDDLSISLLPSRVTTSNIRASLSVIKKMLRQTSKQTARSNCCFRITDRVLVYFRLVSDPVGTSASIVLISFQTSGMCNDCSKEQHRTQNNNRRINQSPTNLNNLQLIRCHELTSRFNTNGINSKSNNRPQKG